jgi:hypothetical protein
MSLRPKFEYQSEIATYLKERLANKTCYDGTFDANWLDPRTSVLEDHCWEERRNRLKYRNRIAKERR